MDIPVTICREQSKLSIDIYRKLTFTDVIIPNDSCHPKEHKMAAIPYLYNRMNSYQLSSDNMQKEKKHNNPELNQQQILRFDLEYYE
jgi:hypothetical protein